MNLRNLLTQDSDSFNEKLKIAVCSLIGLKIIVGFALAAMLFSCDMVVDSVKEKPVDPVPVIINQCNGYSTEQVLEIVDLTYQLGLHRGKHSLNPKSDWGKDSLMIRRILVRK